MKQIAKRYGLAAAIAVLYLYSFPYFEQIHSANELPRIYLTRAMVEDGTFAIDSGVKRWGTTADVSPSGGHLYSNKAPGSSFLAVPSYLVLKGVKHVLGGGPPTLAEMTWTFRFATGMLPTLLFLLLLWRFLARFCPRPESRRLALAGYALGSMAMTYSVLFIAHQLSAVCIGTTYILSVWVVEDGRDPRWLFLAGLAAGAAPLCDYQAAFAGVPVAAYLIWHLGIKDRRRLRGIALAIAGTIPPVALLLFYHWRAFGSPWRTGYNASKTFARYHQQGFLGFTHPTWHAFVGSTVAPDNGLILFCPMVLLAIPGWIVLWRQKKWWHVGITGVVAAFYLYFISSLTFWRGGWELGPRYITAMLPFLMVPIAAAVSAADADRRSWARAGAVALIAVGIAVYALSSAEYPHFPLEFTNPLYGITFRLIADGHAPYNIGWIFGLRGLASLVPYFAVLAAVVAWVAVPARARLRSGLIGIALAVAILGAYSFFPRGGRAADRAYARWVAGVMPDAR